MPNFRKALAAAIAAAVMAAAIPAWASTGDMVLRLDVAQIAGFDCVTNEDVLAGLTPGASAIMIPMGRFVSVSIPQVLKDAPGHPYTLVMKIKTQISEGWVSLLNMPDSNDSDAMIYLHRTLRTAYRLSGSGAA